MSNNINILEIMENAISSLKDNKESVIAIVQNLQAEYEQKKLELDAIKVKLPEILLETAKLKTLDKSFRNKLVEASHDFSANGHRKMQLLFEQANETHAKLFEAEKLEQSYVEKRNRLEFELKKLKSNIELAESMAKQLIVSLSYLQLGISEVQSKPALLNDSHGTASYDPILAAFRCIEDEKSRIARDLHDGPTQRIASVQMRIDFCKTAITIDLEKGLGLLEHLKQDLAYTLSEVREILFDLNPAPLEKLGFKSCIEHLLLNASEKSQLRTDFSYELDELSLDLSIQNNIYRIIQELINNVKKHAKATTIRLALTATDDFIYITFEDDGVGFTVPENFEVTRTQNKSYGLFNIYTRINNLDGILKVTSSKNKGSCFKIQLPLLLA